MARMIRDWGIALLVGFLVFVGADWLANRPPPAGEAPAFTLADLDGATVSLADYRGKTVVLNFWATWCAPCRAEIPELTAYAQENPEVPVLGVVVPSNEGARLKEIVQRFGPGYPVLVADDAVERAYRLSVFPTTVVVRPDGSVAVRHEGAVDRAGLAALVAKAGG